MDKTTFLQEAQKYVEGLRRFITVHELPGEWFGVADHVAVKGRDAADFEQLLKLFRPLAQQLTCIDMDGRRLATAWLKEPIAIGNFGSVEWVEIMEPRPEKVGKDVVGFEHMEFYFPDFVAIRAVLDHKGVKYEMEQNPGHQWVDIVINQTGQELKLNNRTLADVIPEELASGKAYLV
ncbi:MAG TPA: VOC family protein [Candidatus Limnocylindria bacterium]|nr:VOC family protein [Candidatus Limnocylindria bacterium]